MTNLLEQEGYDLVRVQNKLELSYRTLRERVEQFARTLNAPSVTLTGSVEIDEVYAFAGLKGHESAQGPRSRSLSTRGHGSYAGDKPPVFTLVDRGSNNRLRNPCEIRRRITVRLLLDNHKQESLTVYTGEFWAYDLLDDDDTFARQYVVYSDGEYAGEDVRINTCESHRSQLRPWLSPPWGISKMS